ncbi:MAG: pilin [Methylococcales bacterium]|nr:pilin [Methylococcales bacterium]
MNKQNAFTLIELMIVIAIISILSSFAMPTFQSRVIRTQIRESIDISEAIKTNIHQYYQKNRQFPANNAQAGLPKADYLIGNFFTKIEVIKGAIHVHLGNRINKNVRGKILSFRPAVVENSPQSPVAWSCGYAEAVNGMKAIGDNKTNVPPAFLEMGCRSWQVALKKSPNV